MSSYLCSDICVLHSFRYRLENKNGALSSWLKGVKHVPVGRSWTQSQGVHFQARNGAFSPLPSPAELYPRAAVPWVAMPASAGHTWPKLLCSLADKATESLACLREDWQSDQNNLFCPENILIPGRLRNDAVLV